MRAFAILLLGCMVVVASGCAEEEGPVGEVSIPAEKQFVVYDFWAPWCGPCKAFAPIFEKWEAKYKRSNVAFKHVNIDEEPKMAEQFHIEGIPTVIVTADGKEVGRMVGGRTGKKILSRRSNRHFDLHHLYGF